MTGIHPGIRTEQSISLLSMPLKSLLLLLFFFPLSLLSSLTQDMGGNTGAITSYVSLAEQGTAEKVASTFPSQAAGRNQNGTEWSEME